MVRNDLRVKAVFTAVAGITMTLQAVSVPSSAQAAPGSRQLPATHQLSSASKPLSLDGVVAVPGSTFAWAFGTNGFGGVSSLVTFDGRKWSKTKAKLPATTVLTGAASVSKRAVWITGAIGNSLFGTRQRPYLAQYFGGRLHAVRLRPFRATQLNAISMVTASNAWAVGARHSSTSHIQPLALHWNGHSWRQVSVLSERAGLSLTSVSATGSHTVWATAVTKSGKSEVLRFNGRHWSLSLTAPGIVQFNAIASASDANAWVVGDGATGNGYSAHWDGRHWTSVAAPNLTTMLLGVTMVGRKAWAVGEAFVNNSSGRAVPEMLVSTGRAWSRQRVPDPGASSSSENQSTFEAISAASARFAIAVGENGVQCSPGSGFADISRGHAWEAAPLPPRVEFTGGLSPECGG